MRKESKRRADEREDQEVGERERREQRGASMAQKRESE